MTRAKVRQLADTDPALISQELPKGDYHKTLLSYLESLRGVESVDVERMLGTGYKNPGDKVLLVLNEPLDVDHVSDIVRRTLEGYVVLSCMHGNDLGDRFYTHGLPSIVVANPLVKFRLHEGERYFSHTLHDACDKRGIHYFELPSMPGPTRLKDLEQKLSKI